MACRVVFSSSLSLAVTIEAKWMISNDVDRPNGYFQIFLRSDFMKNFRVFVEEEMDL